MTAALMAIFLLSVTGLAIDGGLEAAKYRNAQNAADAGAIAGTRTAYADLLNGTAFTPADQDAAANASINDNGAHPGLSMAQPTGVLALLGVDNAEAATPSGGGYPEPASIWGLQPGTTTTADSSLADLQVTASTPPILGTYHRDTIDAPVEGTNLSVSPANGATAAAASGQVSVASLNASSSTVVGGLITATATAQASVSCYQSVNTTPGQSSCPSGLLSGVTSLISPLTVGNTATVNQQTTQSTVNSQGNPTVSNNNTLVSVNNTVLGALTVGATQVTTASSSLPTGNGYRTDASVVLLNPSVALTAPGVSIGFSASLASDEVTAQNNTVTANPVCAPGAALNITAPGFTGSVSLTASCALGVSIPSIAGVSITPGYVHPNPPTCPVDSAGTGYQCTVTACVLNISVTVDPLNPITLCLGKAEVSTDVLPSPNVTISGPGGTGTVTGPGGVGSCSSSSCTVTCTGSGCRGNEDSQHNGNQTSPPPCTGNGCSDWCATSTCTVTVTGSGGSAGCTGSGCHVTCTGSGCSGPGGTCTATCTLNGYHAVANVPSPIFFLRVIGWGTQYPAAQATAQVEQVTDVTDSAWSNASFAMPDYAERMDSGNNFETLTVGHDYYLYGSQMPTYSPVASFDCPSCNWQGYVSASTNGHAIGSTLTGVNGNHGGPGTYNGGDDYLLPVVASTGLVEWWGQFAPVAGHPGWGKLVNSVPSAGGTLVQANAAVGGASWQPGALGAATLKLIG